MFYNLQVGGPSGPDSAPVVTEMNYGVMLLKMVIALAVVLVLIYVVMKLLARYYAPARLNRDLRYFGGIVETFRIDRGHSFAILQVKEQLFLFGKGPNGLTNLVPLQDAHPPAPDIQSDSERSE